MPIGIQEDIRQVILETWKWQSTQAVQLKVTAFASGTVKVLGQRV